LWQKCERDCLRRQRERRNEKKRDDGGKANANSPLHTDYFLVSGQITCIDTVSRSLPCRAAGLFETGLRDGRGLGQATCSEKCGEPRAFRVDIVEFENAVASIAAHREDAGVICLETFPH